MRKSRIRDLHEVEKLARLGHPRTVPGVPEAEAPERGEIGYDAPMQSLVLYYEAFGRWPELVRMGRLDGDLQALRDLPDGTQIRSQVPAF